MEIITIKKSSENYPAVSLLLIILLTFVFNLTYAQPKSNTIAGLNDWTATINGGMVSYYGDLSNYDHNYLEKLNNESGFGYGLIISKNLDRAFSLSGQLIAGNFSATHQNIQIETSLFEYNLQARLNFIEMFVRDDEMHKLGITGFAGLGNFIFDSKRTTFYEGGSDVETYKARVPEFIYFFGGGLQYRIYNGLDISLELSIRQFQNDKIDLEVAGNDYDYYSYLQFGLSYSIDNIFRSEEKRNAGMANSLSRQRPIYR